MDLDGLNFSTIMSKKDEINELAKLSSEISTNYYPEIGHKVIIVNAPFVFNMLWKIGKSFLNEKTVKRVAVYGSGYKKDLLKIVDEEQLPTFLGGKNQTPLEVGMFDDLFRYERLIKQGERLRHLLRPRTRRAPAARSRPGRSV